MQNSRSSLLGVALVLAAALLWGTTGTAQSFAPPGLSAYWVGALRLVVASAFFGAFCLLQPPAGGWAACWRSMPWPGVLLAGAAMAAYNLCFFAGVKASGVAVGTAVALGSGPIWAGLLQWAFQRRMPRGDWWLGTLLAVAGGVLMVGGASGAAGQQGGSPVLGLVLCLGAGLSYAAYALVNKQLVTGRSASAVTLGAFSAAALMAVPAAAMVAGGFATSWAGWAVVAYLGVAATGVAYLLFSSALQRISGPTGVALALGEPVTAFFLAIAVVGEQPPPAAYAGLALVLAGLAVVIWAEVRPRPPGRA